MADRSEGPIKHRGDETVKFRSGVGATGASDRSLCLKGIEPALRGQGWARDLDGVEGLHAKGSIATGATRRSLAEALQSFFREKEVPEKFRRSPIRVRNTGEEAVRAHTPVVVFPCNSDRALPGKDDIE